MTARSAVRILGTAAIVAGMMALLYVGVVIARSRATTTKLLGDHAGASSAECSVLVAECSVPLGGARVLVPGELLGSVRIERLGVAAEIREGESDSVLRDGVGHLSDTPWLGAPGNVALAGHRDTVFRALRDITPGDVIEIVTTERTARYAVEATSVVTPDDLSVLEPAGGSRLTLITCYPFNYIGSAPNRFIVRAREISPASPDGR
jgi:LPXTG-site transpeptidase (sortase) family protein